MGINWDSLHKGITQEEPAFTAAQVYVPLPPSFKSLVRADVRLGLGVDGMDEPLTGRPDGTLTCIRERRAARTAAGFQNRRDDSLLPHERFISSLVFDTVATTLLSAWQSSRLYFVCENSKR